MIENQELFYVKIDGQFEWRTKQELFIWLGYSMDRLQKVLEEAQKKLADLDKESVK